MTPARTPTPVAIRQSRHRERQRRGARVIPVEVDTELLGVLIDRGFLRPYEEDDPECIARALVNAARG